MLSFLFTADEDGVHNKAWSDIKIWIEWLLDAIDDYKASLNGAKPSISNFITSLKQSKVNAEAAGEATEGFSLKLLALRARALLLNAALGVGIGLLISWGTKKISDAAQRVQNVATQSKEAADAATNTTSSLKDLTDAYSELGDKSTWDTEDFDQAKDIQEEILELAKEQGTLDEEKVSKLDLQNGKYQEQLALLQDITEEQLQASRYELTQNKDAQSDKLVQTAKKNNRSHLLTVWSSPEMDMGDQIKKAGIDIFNKFGGYGPDDLNDADSIVDYYNEVGKALKYVIDNTTEAERTAGGTYHNLYQFLLDEQAALQDDVDAYNDSTDAINDNTNARAKLHAVDFWQNDSNNSFDVSFTFDKVNSAVQTLKDSIDGLDANKLNELLWGTNEGLTDEQAQALTALRTAITDMDFTADTDGVNAFIQALVQLGVVAGSTAGSIDAVAQAAQDMEEISSKIDEIQAAYKNATTAIEEYNKYGYLSADTLQTLLNEDFEYLSCLELVDGQLQVNTEKYQGMIAAQYQSAAMALVEKANAELAKIAQGEKKDAVEDATKATEDQATALTERVCPALGEFAKASMTAAAAQEFLANGDAAWSVDPERTKEVYAGLASGLEILDSTVDQIMGNSDKFRQHMNGFDKETKNKTKSASKSVTDVASAFDTLNKAMKEYNQYGYLCADTAKSLVSLDDKFTACLTKQGDKLQINVAQFRKFVKAQLEEANAANDGGKSAAEMNKILSYLNENVDSETISFEQLTDAIKGYGTAMDEAKEKTDAIKSAFSGLSDVLKTLSESQFGIPDLDATEKQIEAIQQLVPYAPELINAAVDEKDNINLDTDKFKNALIAALREQADVAAQTGGAGAKALEQSYLTAAKNIEDGFISVNDYINGLGTDLSNANTVLDEYQDTWTTLMDAMNEQNDNGQLTQDTQQKLMELKPEFRALLITDENGNATVNVRELRDQYQTQLKKLAEEFKGKPIGIQAEAMIEDIREPTQEEYEELAKKTVKYQLALAKHTKRMSEIDSNKNLSEDEYLQQKAEVDTELDNALQESLIDVKETDADVTTKLKKHWDGVQAVIENFKNGLNEIKDLLSSFLSLLSTWNNNNSNDLKLWGDTMSKVIDKRIEALNKQKEALEENNDATERAIELAKAQDALARAEQQRTSRVYTENGWEWQANAEDVRSAREDLEDKQRQWNKEDAEKAIDDQIKKYNEFKDKLSEVMDDIGKSWSDYQKELQYTAQIQQMTLGQMEGSLDSYHNQIVASLTNGSVISNIQSVIGYIESLITTLEKLNNIYAWAQTGFVSYEDKGLQGLWNTVKGLINKGSKDIAVDATKELGVSSTGGIVGAFESAWNTIKLGAKSAFGGTGNGILATVSNGVKGIGSVIKNSKIGAAVLGGASKVTSVVGSVVGGVGKVASTIGSALGIGGAATGAGAAIAGGATLPIVGAITGAVTLGVNNAIQHAKEQKEIWSDSDSSFSQKAVKSVGTFLWHSTPFGIVASGVKTISGWCKKLFGKNEETASNTKKTAEEAAKNKASNITNLTINATEGTVKQENVVSNDQTDNTTSSGKTSVWDKIWGSKFWFWNWGKKASGDKNLKHTGLYNVDERGPEIMVRRPNAGRYTYLEAGDGVVPSDITSRLFEMGGNPDAWFQEQLAKNSAATTVQTRSTGGISVSIGDVNVNNPVGDSDALARELVNRLPNKIVQQMNKR